MAAIGFSTLVISELNKMNGECWTRGAKQSIMKSKDNKSSTFLRGIKPRRKIILSHSSPQQSCGVFWKVLDKEPFLKEGR